MTTTAQSIIQDAQEQLQDVVGTRWPATELVRYLNAGQREAAILRPDMFTATAALALVAGPRQSVPAACYKLIEIPRNTAGIPVRQVERNQIDNVEPGWYTKTGSLTVKNFMHDPREPNTFWVYPPALLGASLDITYSTLPADVAAPSGAAFGTVAGNINCPDWMASALMHFCLFRAHSKDAEAGGGAELAAAHYENFKQLLGIDAATTSAVKPTTTDGTTQ